MNLPGYDAWKLASPYDITPEQERELEDRQHEQMDQLREALSATISDERGDLYLADVRRVVIEELNPVKRLPDEPEWQTKTPVPIPDLG